MKVPIDVIATGVDVAKYGTVDTARVDALRDTAGVRPGEKILLFMGRLGREKSVELLLRALWHSRLPNVRLLIGGDGPQRAELEAMVEELGLQEQSHLPRLPEGAGLGGRLPSRRRIRLRVHD